MRTLVIGDAHIQAGQVLLRFKALGQWILDNFPENIVIMGDFLDMQALSAWDKNKRLTMEGRRYKEEIDAGNVALDLLLRPIAAYNTERKAQRKRPYAPHLVYLSGNHEYRLDRYLEEHAELEGQLDYIRELKLRERGFIHIPYREYHYIGGVGFTHIPIGGNGKAMSGAISTQVKNVLQAHAHSVVYGHTHRLAVTGEHRLGAPHYNQVLSCGCFFEHVDEYVKGAKTDYWRGVIVLDHYSENRFDIETLALSKLMKMYNPTIIGANP